MVHIEKIECLVASDNLLGESPVWDPKRETLYWIDAIKPSLHAFDLNTKQMRSWEMPALIGSIALCQSGNLIACLGTGLATIELPSGNIKMQCLIDAPLATRHLNDGKCDRLGRFWFGEVSHNKAAASGRLFCYDKKQGLRCMAEDIRLFNGPCFSPCNTFFYYTDYFADRKIFRYDFSLNEGLISAREDFITIAENDNGIPDGCTVDSEGYLWSAKWNGSRITRYTPTGEIDQELELPLLRPTSCTFGGADYQTLFVTSASRDVGEDESLPSPAGAVYAVKLSGIKGIPETPFVD